MTELRLRSGYKWLQHSWPARSTIFDLLARRGRGYHRRRRRQGKQRAFTFRHTDNDLRAYA
jgi:hypothetical protein